MDYKTNISVMYVTLVPWRRERKRQWASHFERPIYFECKLNEPMHIGMRCLHPAAADDSARINRQQVQRIQGFRWGAEPVTRNKKASYCCRSTTHSVRLDNTCNMNVAEAPSFPKEVSEAFTHMDNRLGAYGRFRGDCNPLGKWQRSLLGKHGLWAILWNLHIWDPLRSLHMAPSPLPALMDSLSEVLAPDAPPHLATEGDGWARQGLQYENSGAVLVSWH